MKKIITSNLTNQQLQQLAHQHLNQNDQTVVDNWMARMAHPQCAPDYFRQDIINFITVRTGQEPDEIVKGMQIREAEKKPTHAPGMVKVTDLSQQGQPQAQHPKTLVAVPCFVCGKSVPVPLDQSHKKVWCDQRCYDKSLSQQNAAVNELQKLLTTVGSRFYDCDYNSNLMTAWLRDHRKAVTEENLLDAFLDLKGQLLTTLTPDQIQAMTDKEFDQRAKLEGSYETNTMGGVDLTTWKKRPETVVHSSNKIRFNQLPQTGVR